MVALACLNNVNYSVTVVSLKLTSKIGTFQIQPFTLEITATAIMTVKVLDNVSTTSA